MKMPAVVKLTVLFFSVSISALFAQGAANYAAWSRKISSDVTSPYDDFGGAGEVYFSYGTV